MASGRRFARPSQSISRDERDQLPMPLSPGSTSLQYDPSLSLTQHNINLHTQHSNNKYSQNYRPTSIYRVSSSDPPVPYSRSQCRDSPSFEDAYHRAHARSSRRISSSQIAISGCDSDRFHSSDVRSSDVRDRDNMRTSSHHRRAVSGSNLPSFSHSKDHLQSDSFVEYESGGGGGGGGRDDVYVSRDVSNAKFQSIDAHTILMTTPNGRAEAHTTAPNSRVYYHQHQHHQPAQSRYQQYSGGRQAELQLFHAPSMDQRDTKHPIPATIYVMENSMVVSKDDSDITGDTEQDMYTGEDRDKENRHREALNRSRYIDYIDIKRTSTHDSSAGWNCHRCTLENNPTYLICGACGTVRVQVGSCDV